MPDVGKKTVRRRDDGASPSVFTHDAGLRALFDRGISKRHPWLGSFLLLVATPAALFLLVALFEDSVVLDGDGMGLVEDRVMGPLLLSLWVAVLLVRRALGMVGEAFADVRQSVETDRVSDAQFRREVDRVWALLDGEPLRPDDGEKDRGPWQTHRVIRFWLMAGGFAAWVWFAVTHYYFIGYDESVEVWRFGSHPAGFVAGAAVDLLLLVFIWPILIYKILALIYAMNSFFRRLGDNAFKLRPLSPDGAGGLGEMGRLALNMEYVFLPFVAVALIAYFAYGQLAIGWVLVPGLALCLVAVFWAPLLSAHNAMAKAKHDTLTLFEREFNDHYDVLLVRLETPGASLDDDKASKTVEGIEKLHRLYERTRKMPVWPFDMRVVRRFTATIAVPALVVAIPEILFR